MSGAQVSSFPSQNILFEAASGQALQRSQQNALLQAQTQQSMDVTRQNLADADTERVARLSQWMLTESGGDPTKMASLYSQAVADEQRQGRLPNAPTVFPGEAIIRRMASAGTSSEKQGAERLRLQGNNALLGNLNTGQPGVASTPGATTPSALAIPPRGTGGPGAEIAMPPELLAHFREASAETGIPMDLLIAQARQESGFRMDRPGGAGEVGIMQIKPSTARDPGGMAGVDPATLSDARQNILFGARYLRSRMQGDPNDPAVQAAALRRYNGGGDPEYVAHVNRYRPGMSPTDPARQVTTYQPQVAPEQQPGAPGGGRVQVASLTPTVATDATTVAPTPSQQQPGQQTATTTQPQQPAANDPAVPPPGRRFTPAQERDLQALAPTATTPQIAAQMAKFDDDNRIARENALTRQRQAQTDQEAAQRHAQTLQIQQSHLQLAQEANQRANQEAAAKATAAGETFVPGTGIEAVHENTVQKYADKMRRGEKLTEKEQSLYDGAYYALQQTGGQSGVMTDPNNPGQQIPYQTTRRLAPSLPEPKGGALPAVISQPGAAKVDQPSADQGKVAGFADRIQMALPIITDTSPAAMSRWQQLLGQAPILGNSLITEEFQQHMQAERNFINATLRRESGAEIKQTEFDNARKQYIPQPGDGPKVLEQKARNRETILNGMIREAGPAYKPPAKTPDSTSGGESKPSKVIKYGPDGKRIEG